jgi:hypothetical protein
MLDEEADRAGSEPKESRLKQAQAMLTLFEADRGRAAVNLEEIREWAFAQDDEQLRHRMGVFLSNSPVDDVHGAAAGL